MTADTSLHYRLIEDTLWIRCNSRGSFLNSPSIKSIADRYIADGGTHIVVDLELCPGVDSTFMGTLAGIARQCMGAGGSVEIASPTDRTRSAMLNLGLDALLSIDPPDAPWLAHLDTIRGLIENDESQEGDNNSAKSLSEIERTKHVLEAHTTLRGLNEKNEESFGYVCESLEDDLKRREEDPT